MMLSEESISEILSKENLLTVESINRSVFNYLKRNTFNNVEVLVKKGALLSLDVNDLYRKIYEEKRGGYCFEHNKLFYFALLAKGVDCESHLARVVYGRDVDIPRTHRIIIAQFENKSYLVDVGCGQDTPTKMIPLSGEVVECHMGIRYRVQQTSEREYQLEILKPTTPFVLYKFELINCSESDFDIGNYYSNTHPQSKHTTNLVMSRFTEEESFILINGIFIKKGKKDKQESELQNKEELFEICKKYFDIKLSEDESVKLFDFILKKRARESHA